MGDSKATTSEWHKNNGRRKLMIYFKTEKQRDEWEALAASEKAPRFSRWILEKAERGITEDLMDPGLMETYKSQIEALQEAVEYERSVAIQYREEVQQMAAKVQEYADIFATLAREKMD